MSVGRKRSAKGDAAPRPLEPRHHDEIYPNCTEDATAKAHPESKKDPQNHDAGKDSTVDLVRLEEGEGPL